MVCPVCVCLFFFFKEKRRSDFLGIFSIHTFFFNLVIHIVFTASVDLKMIDVMYLHQIGCRNRLLTMKS